MNAQEKMVLLFQICRFAIEITKLESLPFGVIAAKTMNRSNAYTRNDFACAREQAGDKTNPKIERGTWLESCRIFYCKRESRPTGIHRRFRSFAHDLITPSSAVQLYTYMSKSRYANVWRDAQTVGAVDGTLQNRFKGTIAAGNVRGKTGTVDQVSSLSGYVNSASGEKFVFSVIVNAVNNVRMRQSAIDEIVLSLANFNGKVN